MRANPGGEIAPEDVVGRGRFIRRVWEVLRSQSVVLEAERRMGKTSVVKKMRSAPPDDLEVVYRDVEGVSTPLEFAEAVAGDVESRLTGLAKTGAKLSRLWKHLSGAEIGGIVKFPSGMAEHWKSLLQATIEDLVDHSPQHTWVFVWDELPLMLQKIRHGGDESGCMDVLDTLRGLRQMHGRLRMVYTGSVGLHHVVSGLYTGGPSNDPTNDMRTMEVTELEAECGKQLACDLIHGEGLRCSSEDETAVAITRSVDHVPFYIHSVVSSLRDQGEDAEVQQVHAIVEQALVGAQDPWHLKHYRQRLNGYYDHEQLHLALWILDELSGTSEPLPFREVAQRFRSSTTRRPESGVIEAVLNGDDEPLRAVVELLERDHYLHRVAGAGAFQFRFPLIQRWWKLQRGD